MRFPQATTKDNRIVSAPLPHHNTVLDGEMVVERDPSTGKHVRRFYAYDIMALNGTKLIREAFKMRYNLIEERVVLPRKHEGFLIASDAQYKHRGYDYGVECFKVRRKGFYPLHCSETILTTLIPKRLCHESDGLIFQGWEDPYVPLTHHDLLKWKYAHLNSVDFRMDWEEGKGGEGGEGGGGGVGGRGHLSVQYGGQLKRLEGCRFALGAKAASDGVTMASLSGRIVECSWDPHTETWVFMRERRDKRLPNAGSVYAKVVRSISDNIDQDRLVAHIAQATKEAIYAKDNRIKVPM